MMNRGKIDEIGDKHEIFENPKTFSVATMTCYKNISAAKKITENKIDGEDIFEVEVVKKLRIILQIFLC